MSENTNLSKITYYNMIDDAVSEYIFQLNKIKSSINEESQWSKKIKNNLLNVWESIKSMTIKIKITPKVICKFICILCILITQYFLNLNLYTFAFMILILVVWFLFNFQLDRNNVVNSPNLLEILENFKIDSSNNYVLDKIKNYIIKYYINSSIFYYVYSILDSMNSKIVNMILSFTIVSNIGDILKLMKSTRIQNLQCYIFKILFSIFFAYFLIYLILNLISLFDNSYKYKKIIREIEKIKMKNICVLKESGDVNC